MSAAAAAAYWRESVVQVPRAQHVGIDNPPPLSPHSGFTPPVHLAHLYEARAASIAAPLCPSHKIPFPYPPPPALALAEHIYRGGNLGGGLVADDIVIASITASLVSLFFSCFVRRPGHIEPLIVRDAPARTLRARTRAEAWLIPTGEAEGTTARASEVDGRRTIRHAAWAGAGGHEARRKSMEFAFTVQSLHSAMTTPPGACGGTFSSPMSFFSEPLSRLGSLEGLRHESASPRAWAAMGGGDFYAAQAASPAAGSPSAQHTEASPTSTAAYCGSPEAEAERAEGQASKSYASPRPQARRGARASEGGSKGADMADSGPGRSRATIPCAAFTRGAQRSRLDGGRTWTGTTSTGTRPTRKRSRSTATTRGARGGWTRFGGWTTSATTCASFTRRTLRSAAAAAARREGPGSATYRQAGGGAPSA